MTSPDAGEKSFPIKSCQDVKTEPRTNGAGLCFSDQAIFLSQSLRDQLQKQPGCSKF